MQTLAVRRGVEKVCSGCEPDAPRPLRRQDVPQAQSGRRAL